MCLLCFDFYFSLPYGYSSLMKVNQRSHACLIVDLWYIIMLKTDHWSLPCYSTIYNRQLSLHGAVLMI